MNFQELYDRAISISEQKESSIAESFSEVLCNFNSYWVVDLERFYEQDWLSIPMHEFLFTLIDPYDNIYAFCVDARGRVKLYNEEEKLINGTNF